MLGRRRRQRPCAVLPNFQTGDLDPPSVRRSVRPNVGPRSATSLVVRRPKKGGPPLRARGHTFSLGSFFLPPPPRLALHFLLLRIRGRNKNNFLPSSKVGFEQRSLPLRCSGGHGTHVHFLDRNGAMKWVGPFLHIPNLPIIVASDDDGNNSIISDDSRKFVGSVREGTSIAPLLIKAGLSQKDIKKQKEGIQIGSRCFIRSHLLSQPPN